MEELPQAAGQALPKDNINNSTASCGQLPRRQAGQNSRRDVWPQGTDPTGLSRGFSLWSSQALQRPFVFFFQPSLSDPCPCVTSALGTHTLRVTRPVCGRERMLGKELADADSSPSADTKPLQTLGPVIALPRLAWS